jgi:hypothetical protein
MINILIHSRLKTDDIFTYLIPNAPDRASLPHIAEATVNIAFIVEHETAPGEFVIDRSRTPPDADFAKGVKCPCVITGATRKGCKAIIVSSVVTIRPTACSFEGCGFSSGMSVRSQVIC